MGLAYLDERETSLEATIDHVALVEQLPEAGRELMRSEFLGNGVDKPV